MTISSPPQSDLSTNLEMDCSVGSLPTAPSNSVGITEGAASTSPVPAPPPGHRCQQMSSTACCLEDLAMQPELGGHVSHLSYVLAIVNGIQTGGNRNRASVLVFSLSMRLTNGFLRSLAAVSVFLMGSKNKGG